MLYFIHKWVGACGILHIHFYMFNWITDMKFYLYQFCIIYINKLSLVVHGCVSGYR